MYQYRVRYQRGDEPEQTWASCATREDADEMKAVAEEEGRWGRLWIERSLVPEWERCDGP